VSANYLVFALQGLGDGLEATPLIAALRSHDPDAQVDVAVTRPTTQALFEALRGPVRDVIVLPFWTKGSVAFVRALLARGRDVRYDASFMAYPAAKAPYHLTNAAFRAERKIAHAYAMPSAALLLRTYTDLVPIRDAHNVERNLDLLAPLGVPAPHRPAYLVPASWRSPARDPALVTLHIGTIAHDGFENKRWPLEAFASLARRLAAAGLRVTTVAGPEELADAALLARQAPELEIVQGDLGEVALHLSRSALVVANDSGIGHLAAAVATPTITLLGPTPATCAPYGDLAVALRPSDCPPCFSPYARGISCVRSIDFKCIRSDIPVEFVFDRARLILNGPPQPAGCS
jgi:ADP-heptose:LPS heptosyltransferase